MDCIFCKIISGEIPSYTIYEDDLVKVLLDIHPRFDGDSLIIPKKHSTNISDTSDEVLSHVQCIIKKMYSKYKKRLHCNGMSLLQNNEFDQEIKHYHFHMIPRYQNNDDKIEFKTSANNRDIKEIYQILK